METSKNVCRTSKIVSNAAKNGGKFMKLLPALLPKITKVKNGTLI